jgi:hypothetical protein
MPLGFLKRKESKWHVRVDNLKLDEAPVYPRGTLNTFTKAYLGTKRRGQDEIDQKLEALIKSHASKADAFAACVSALSAEAVIRVIDEHFRVNAISLQALPAYLQDEIDQKLETSIRAYASKADAFAAYGAILSAGAVTRVIDEHFPVDTNSLQGLPSYLLVILGVFKVRKDIFVARDRNFAATIAPIAAAITTGQIRPDNAVVLFDAWQTNPPSDAQLLERVQVLTHKTIRHIATDLAQFKAGLSEGVITRAGCERALKYRDILSRVRSNGIFLIRALDSDLCEWQRWAYWQPKVPRLLKWADSRSSAFAFLIGTEGPDCEGDLDIHNRTQWQAMIRSGVLLLWLQAHGYTIGVPLMTGDTESSLTIFMEAFLDAATLSRTSENTQLLEYLIWRDELDLQPLNTWQALRGALQQDFVNILLKRTPLKAADDDVDVVVQGLDWLSYGAANAVRPILREVADSVRRLVQLLVDGCCTLLKHEVEWIRMARRLWRLRDAVITSDWLHSHLDPAMVDACRSRPSDDALTSLFDLQNDLTNRQVDIGTSLTTYIQQFILEYRTAGTVTTAIPKILHSVWESTSSPPIREVTLLVVSLGIIPQADRINCIKDVQKCSIGTVDRFLDYLHRIIQGEIQPIVGLTDIMASMASSSDEPEGCRGMLLLLIEHFGINIQTAELVMLNFANYSQWILTLHGLIGNMIPDLQPVFEWITQLSKYTAAIQALEALEEFDGMLPLLLTAHRHPQREQYVTAFECLGHRDLDRVQLLQQVFLSSRLVDLSTVEQAMVSINAIHAHGFARCQGLIALCRESRELATLRLAIGLRMSPTASDTARTLFNLGKVLQLGVDEDFSIPASAVPVSRTFYAKQVSRLISLTQQLEQRRMMLRRKFPVEIMAMMEELNLEQPQGVEILMGDLPNELVSFVEATSDDQIELHLPLSDPETTAIQRLAFGLTGAESLSVHLRVDDDGTISGVCVHLDENGSSSGTQAHSWHTLPHALEKPCGTPSRLTYILSRELWRMMQDKSRWQLIAIYEATRRIMKISARQCMVCGNNIGAYVHRPSRCSGQSCHRTWLQSDLEIRLADVRTDERVVDLLLASVFAVASVNNLALLPNWPARLNDPVRLLHLLNSLPATDALAKVPNLGTGLRKYGQRAELLYSWMLNSFGGLLVTATGRFKIPSLANVHQFLQINACPEIEARFQTHHSIQPRRILYHGTSMNRLYAILTQGLQVLSNTPLMNNAAVHGPGIYMAREPSTAWMYAAKAATVAMSSFFTSRPDFLNARVVLVCEHAGNNDGVGHGIHVVTDVSRLMLRYLFIYQDGVAAPRAQDISTALLSTCNYLRTSATAS